MLGVFFNLLLWAEENEYEVKKILKKRTVNGVLHYYVSWKDFGKSWEPFYHLENCKELINDFEKRLEKKNTKRKKREHEKGKFVWSFC